MTPEARSLEVDRSPRAVFLGFAKIGATAFGGGSATTVAVRRMCIANGWMTEQEFLETVVLGRLSPGITILAQVLLIGKKVSGAAGMVAGVAGMMLPAATITIALAAVYDLIRGSPSAATPLRSVTAVAAGFAVALALQLLRDTLKGDHGVRGPLMFLIYLGLAAWINNPVVVLGIGLVVGVMLPALFGGPDEADER